MSTQDPYRLIARFYDRIIEPIQAGVRKVALGVVPPQRGWQILDVGCGTGTGLELYADAGCRVVGVDVSDAMLDRAQVRLSGKAELHRTAGDALPFDDDRFDLVTASMVLHEVPAPARTAFVAEMARVTKSDGRMLLIDHRFDDLRGWKGPTLRAISGMVERVSGHHSGYRSFKASGGVRSALHDAGLDVEREKVVAGGNIAVYVVSPSGPSQPST